MAPAVASAPTVAIAVRTAADRVRDRPSDRAARRTTPPARLPTLPTAATINGEAHTMPPSTHSDPMTASIASKSPGWSTLVEPPSRNSPITNDVTPTGPIHDGGVDTGRRPASADSTGIRAAERAGTSAAIIAAAAAVATITTMSSDTISSEGTRWSKKRSPNPVRCTSNSPASARNTPSNAPNSPVQSPCRPMVRRTRRSGAPLAESWPIVTS